MPLSDISKKDQSRFTEGCAYRIGKTLVQGAMGGAIIGTGMLAWYPDPYLFDSKGTVVSKPLDLAWLLKNMKGPVMWGSIACATFSGVECIFEQLRDESKSSTWVNSTFAGAATGVVLGSMTKRIDIMATSALGLGTLMGLIEYNDSAAAKSTPKPTVEEQVNAVKDATEVTVASLKEKYPEFKNL